MTEELNKDVKITLQWQFENIYEFILYCHYVEESNGKIAMAEWKQGDDYVRMLKHGCEVFESGDYAGAMKIYYDSLAINPVGIAARGEIAECLIRMYRWNKAKQFLLESAKWFVNVPEAARFYRRMGYIAIENGNWELGFACYLFSCEYENSDLAKNEIAYILQNKGANFRVDNPRQIIINAGIPVIEAMNFDTLDVPIKDAEV